MASFTVAIFSASSSGMSISKASSKAITNSTISSESAPRSSTNEAVLSTWLSSTPNCSTMICFTLCSTDMSPPKLSANSLILAMMAGGCNYAPIATIGPVKILTVLLVRIRSVRSGFLILSVVWLSPQVLAQDTLVTQALPQIAKQASKFWQIAPGYMAKETLKQRAAVMPKRKFRIGGGAIDPPKPELKDREIVSYYSISSFRNSPEALHEFRQVVSVDGKTVAPEAGVLEKFRTTLASPDDRSRKTMQADFEKTGLAIAATDFGQLVLLFTKSNLEKYTFQPQST